MTKITTNRKRTGSFTNLAILLPLLLALFAATTVIAQEKDWESAAKSDPLLQAMRTVIDRSKSTLKLDRVAAPYFIEYRVIDADEYSAEAAFGSLRTDARLHVRFLRVTVRVGDYKQDGKSSNGAGALNITDFMSLDDDPPTLEHTLWLATDKAYKEAAVALAAKQAQLKQFNTDQTVDDFSHAEPAHSVAPLVKLDFDSVPWTRMLQNASALYKSDPLIEAFESRLSFSAVNQYYVNSEGTIIRSGRNLYQMYIACGTQAGDGMSLPRNNGFVVTNIRDLPTEKEFVTRAGELAASLKELRDAPVVDEEYRGPILFSADASTTVFAELVGEHILARRPELGKTSRTTGAFAASYKSRVLPDFLSVVDDPTISSYRDQSLLGHYDFDDEGTPARRVSVIEQGTLINYLIGRESIRDFPASNGHARARVPATTPGPTNPLPHIGNLIVSSSQPVPKYELRKRFLDICRQRDLPYCYFVETFGSKLAPRLLYRVWTKDGHQELVRGATFGDLDTRALRSDLIAASDDVYVDNRPTNVPHSIVAPSILFDELEIKRATTNRDKLPEYPSPPSISGK
jgi:TldD protein